MFKHRLWVFSICVLSFCASANSGTHEDPSFCQPLTEDSYALEMVDESIIAPWMPDPNYHLSEGNPLIRAMKAPKGILAIPFLEPKRVEFRGLMRFLISKQKWRAAEVLASAGYFVEVHPRDRGSFGPSPLKDLKYWDIREDAKPDFIVSGQNSLPYHFFNYISSRFRSATKLTASIRSQVTNREAKKFVVDFSNESDTTKLDEFTSAVNQMPIYGLVEILAIVDSKVVYVFPPEPNQ